MQKDFSELIRLATRAREYAHSSFSGFKVGAAILTKKGKTYTGCNIESASYGLTVCAERVAIWKAISEGERDFSAIAVVADTNELTPPCGACRQIIWEFCGDIVVVLANLQGKTKVFKMSKLLPNPFDSKFLNS
ncbi:MAG: cytidine deaminase [Acidobacteria bacterium]|jgi:cytidine deaminase|nr:MAG: cytidine deaminase [Acidobacteriota bacterium]GIU81238.1 MAG: cytidine deaminase [Pyrinomonadaceae bacterium]